VDLIGSVKPWLLKKIYRLVRWTIPEAYSDALKKTHETIQSQSRLPYWERRVDQNRDGQPVEVGFVGAGRYAQHHLKVLADLPGVHVSSILTTGAPRVLSVASTYGIERIFASPEDFCSQDSIDCFVVVAPSYKIKDVAKQCLSTGKPVLIDEAEKYNTFGMVCMNRRFYSGIEHGLAALAQRGPIRGGVLEIPIAITRKRQSGALTDWEYDREMFQSAIHAIDLLRYIVGDVLRVHSYARPNEHYKNASASYATILEHEHGQISTLLGLWDTSSVWRLKVISERGWIEFEPLESGGWLSDERGKKAPIRQDPVDLKYRMGVYGQDAHFIEAVRERRVPRVPACLLPDAYNTNLLIEQILSNNLGNRDHRPHAPAC
jgi:predicted dehydrogenase